MNAWNPGPRPAPLHANIRSACERANCWSARYLDASVPGDVFRCEHGKVYVLRSGLDAGSSRWENLHPVLTPRAYWRARRAIAAERRTLYGRLGARHVHVPWLGVLGIVAAVVFAVGTLVVTW